MVVTARRAPAGGGVLAWDIEAGPPPEAVRGAAVLVSLAGVTAGPEVGRNRDLGLAALDAAAAAGIGQVFLISSAAVYGAVPEGAAREEDAPRPAGAYGAAKAAMEAAAQEWRRAAGPGAPALTLLRLGNVVGADALGASLAAGGPVTLDDVGPPGAPAGPMRSWIGPATLARILAALAARAAAGGSLPGVLNVAAPRPLPMEALVAAAGAPLAFRPAPPGAIARVALDTGRLQALAPVTAAEATAAHMAAEARALGAFAWRGAAA